MTQFAQELTDADTESACWVIRYPVMAPVHQLENDIEKMLSGYTFYPEVEWPKYGCVPPEGLPVRGAWRNPQRGAFAFLLEIPTSDKSSKPAQVKRTRQARFYVVGSKDELRRCDVHISNLKVNIEKIERRTLTKEENDLRIQRADHIRSVRNLIAMSSVFTALVNALSLYLRTIGPPDFPNVFVRELYASIIIFIHFSALLLLAILAFISVIYVIKYGALLVGRL